MNLTKSLAGQSRQRSVKTGRHPAEDTGVGSMLNGRH
jgi:hypothetical protein